MFPCQPDGRRITIFRSTEKGSECDERLDFSQISFDKVSFATSSEIECVGPGQFKVYWRLSPPGEVMDATRDSTTDVFMCSNFERKGDKLTIIGDSILYSSIAETKCVDPNSPPGTRMSVHELKLVGEGSSESTCN